MSTITTTITTITTATSTNPRRGVAQDHAAQALHAQLIELLCAVMQGNGQVIKDIERYGQSMRFEQGRLDFTLPDLFAFLCTRCTSESGAQDYLSFRRLIYAQPTNATLRQRGCMVELAQPHAEHARSVYRLVAYRAGE